MARRQGIRWHRWIILLAVLLVVYLGAAGWYLGRIGVGLLTIGPLEAALAAEPVPEDPLALGYRGDPQAALGLPFEDVEIATALGPAPAWYVPAQGQMAALYVHGIAGTREGGFRHLSLLAAAGIPALLVTYRGDAGAPQPPGGAHAFGLTEWQDVEAAADWLVARGHDRILLIGESMGGGIAGQFLQRSGQAERVVAVALDSPAVDLRAVLRHLAGRLRLPLPGLVAPLAERFAGWRLDLPLGAAQVADTFAGFDGPLFIAHGTADGAVPVATSDALVAARQGATVVLRTGADHLASYQADPAGYGAAFAAFLTLIPAQ